MDASIKPEIGLVIVDLDDTLWTWFHGWYMSFSALVEGLSQKTGIDEEQLLTSIKKIHEEKGTSEYSWLVDVLPELKEFSGGQSPREFFDDALHAQNSARLRYTKLYPGVLHTLKYVKSQGVKVIAYTESLRFWTEWRVRKLGLDGVIDVIYSSPDHDFPAGESAESMRTLPDSEYGLKYTEHLNVPQGISKPSPQILEVILKAHSVPGRKTIYIGDSLDRDVAMAHAAGVISVYADYGRNHTKAEYDLLRRVTHWTPSEVERERSSVQAAPDYTLTEGLFEILGLFNFGTPIDTESHLEIWKQEVSVQMHFNDLGWRIRSLAFTIFTFVIGAAGFAYENLGRIKLFDSLDISIAALLLPVGFALWLGFWFTDRLWFHTYLKAAVKDSMRQEEILSSAGIPVDLGGSITQASSSRKRKNMKNRAKEEKDSKWWDSSHKLDAFYLLGGVVFAATFLVLWLGQPLP
ncbi:FMN phosphatase YigB (HAD superfamily) [Neomicrococcus aestuarii]|uniref:FMN phosphatase YigB (HAD superfamily) n=1 Tax=Neomicrococcus aestuarii TaxID=556325 RepID=A0A7W8X1K3_9MICC|nr:HAD family hydrolase [Neomicrococcus aestuarii]MBB5513993.1 FMN phosphatase YigB (HAD superfamily) [Neomicrococcus aestuarii]